MNRLVLLSGRICSGKSVLSSELAKNFNSKILKTSDALIKVAEIRGIIPTRENLQGLGDQLDKETHGAWLFDYLPTVESEETIVVDSVRIKEQVKSFRDKFGRKIVHIHLEAPEEELKKRFDIRQSSNPKSMDANITFEDTKKSLTEINVKQFRKDADIRIDTNRCNSEQTLARVAAQLGLYSSPNQKVVDVLIGGQYGSEGKGQIAAYLAPSYDVLVRTAGPNAGHSVATPDGRDKYHQLPSGCRGLNNKILIAAGAVVNPDIFIKEIREFEISDDRMYLDPQAMVITEEDIQGETALVKSIGSTKSGTGLASARKISGRGDMTLLAKDVPELKKYCRESVLDVLEKSYQLGERILLEGTQGSGLSLHHGDYPYVTSRDTNVAGCLSEAGISPRRVNKVIMVTRTYPIRVQSPEGSTSGDMFSELNWEEIALRSNIPLEELTKTERTTTTNRERRVGEFDWHQFRKACSLNAPTDIALTFVDYLDSKNKEARRFEQLNEDSIRFIQEIEAVAKAPVSLISTRFEERSIIDRRNW